MSKVRWEIDPTATALIIIDMQNDFLLPESPLAARGGLDLIPRVNRLIAAARALRIPVIFTASTYREGENYGRLGDLFPDLYRTPTLRDGTPGWQIHAALDFRPGDMLLKKPRYSAFWKTDLDKILREQGIETLILVGVWSNCCVESTARDAFFRDYKVVYTADCAATGDLPDLGYGAYAAEQVHKITLADLAMHVCEVTSSKDVLARLQSLARSGANVAEPSPAS